MRVTGGAWRGRVLWLPPGVRTRPSSGKLKAALFDMLGAAIEDAVVADLFAGSGALGIEALSRGARRCIFVELEPRCLAAIRANLEALGVSGEAALVRRADARRWLGKLERGALSQPERPAIVLLDPPYERDGSLELLPALRALVESGTLEAAVLEHPASAAPSSVPSGSTLRVTTRQHGLGAFTLVERG